MAVKESLRKIIRAKLEAMEPVVAAAKSMAACKRLMEQAEFECAQTIMIYLPMRGEVDLAPLALRGWQEQKTIVAPRLSWQERALMPVEIRSLETGLVQQGGRGPRQPLAGEPVPVDMLDLVVVPALAFDRHGNRLGRGAGFYDRFLAGPRFRGIAVGLAFREQVVELLPITPNDVPVQLLVTDEEVLRFAPPGPPPAGRDARRK